MSFPSRVHWQFCRQYKQIVSIPLKPSKFCAKWVKKISPSERGYRAECIRELMAATGLEFTTINKWGSELDECPEYVERLLRKEDLLRQIVSMAVQNSEMREFINTLLKTDDDN